MPPFFLSMRNLFRLSRENTDLVFYSEGKSYWINFRDVIESLLDDHKKKLYFITSSILGWRQALGADLEEKDVHLAGEKARALLDDSSWKGRIETFKKDNVFNPGQGGKAIASAIMELLAVARAEYRGGTNGTTAAGRED